MPWDKIDYIGSNTSNNGISTLNVIANRDGSLLERTEFIISMITGGAADLRVSQSVAGTVEENGLLQFTVGLMDIDSGAIASANIDITSITQTMERSRDGSSWSAMTAPSFSKADGQVYCSYQFLAAEWQTGDMYRLTLSGVTCTIGTATAYVPAMIWSNIVVETEDIKTDVKYLYAEADGGTTYPTKVIDNSILSLIMTKDSGGDTSDFDNTTDSLEMLSDKLGAFTGDGGVAQDDSVKASLDLAHTEIGNVYIDTQAISVVVNDIQTNLIPDLSADVTSLQTDLGNPSARTNLKTIEDMLGNPDSAGKSLYEAVKNIRETAIDGSSAPVANTLSDILHKDGSYTYDNTTDSLEAIRDRIDTLASTGVGVPQIFIKSITSAANAGDVTVATVTSQPVILDSIIIHSNGATTSDLTNIAIYTGASKVLALINSTEGAQANINAQDKQIRWPDFGKGSVYLPTGSTIVATLTGTGGTTVDLNIIVEYRAAVSGGYLV